MHPTRIWKLVMFVGLTMAGLLAVACTTGVSQKDYDALKQQLVAKEKEAAELQQKQLKFPGRQASGAILGAIPNAPPRPAPTPLPPGTTPPPPPPPPTPPAAKVMPLYAYIDTVTAGAGESKFNVDANLSCVKTSLFSRGMHIVWRMELVDTATGKVRQGADVKDATLRLPHGEEVKFRFGRHGATDDAPWFWTAAWDVPMDYPIGVLDYTVTVTTQDGKSVTVKDPLTVSNPAAQIESRVTIVS